MADVTFLSASVAPQLFTKLCPVCVAGATPARLSPAPFLFFLFFCQPGRRSDHVRLGKSFKLDGEP